MWAFLLIACLASPATGQFYHEDLVRAKTWKPRSGYRGSGTVASANAQLNLHLAKTKGLRLKACEDFDVPELRRVLRALLPLGSEALQAIYSDADGRRQVYKTLSEMEAHWETAAAAVSDPRVRDAHCHEAVMWFVHHLTKDAKGSAMLKLTLPKLPVADHTTASRDAKDQAGAFYDEKVTCQKCHVNGLENMGAPEVKPTTDKQRARRCYSNYKELFNISCGPCDGVAGKYWGDDDDKYYTPDNCVVVGTAEDIPESQRVKAVFPPQFSVDVVAGSDRWGRTTNPIVSPKTGLPTFMDSMYGQISGNWYFDGMPESDRWLLRHDTKYDKVTLNGTHTPFHFHVSEIHSQTRKQKQENSTGPMVSLVEGLPSFMPGGCTCVADPVGVPDIARTQEAPGMAELQYLGRIKLVLSEYDGSTVELDHWYSWFFHVFMDVNTASPYYGKAPKRLASGYAGTAVYDNWVFADPKIADPTVWHRGIPTSPMKVGPDKGKFCINPKKISMCDSISQDTFPPAPEALPTKHDQKISWDQIHDAFLPRAQTVKSEILSTVFGKTKELFV